MKHDHRLGLSGGSTESQMLASHERALAGARKRGEPAGQIAARELEAARLRQALRRAEELTMDVAMAIEEMAGGVSA